MTIITGLKSMHNLEIRILAIGVEGALGSYLIKNFKKKIYYNVLVMITT